MSLRGMGTAAVERFSVIVNCIRMLGLIVILIASLIRPPSAHGAESTDEILMIVGADGSPEYGQQFQQWAQEWMNIAREASANIQWIGNTEGDDQTDRQRCKSAIDQIAKEADSPLWIVLIGHGTFTRGVAKFNLRGPDLSAAELADWLQSMQRPLVVINNASSSGPFVNQLSGERRVIIAATKSGTEQNFARFGEHFVKGIANLESDLDHDDQVSVLEAFLSASAKVREFYDSQARIVTEHALIDDNGDGKGTPASMFRAARAIGQAKDGTELDGTVASTISLAAKGTRLRFNDEESTRRVAIELELRKLRQRKADLSEAAYDRELEPLLLRLAELYRAVESRSEESPR